MPLAWKFQGVAQNFDNVSYLIVLVAVRDEPLSLCCSNWLVTDAGSLDLGSQPRRLQLLVLQPSMLPTTYDGLIMLFVV